MHVASGAGASLNISPASGSFFLGSTFNVSFALNTGREAINAIEVEILFPPDKIQVVNPSIGTSFVSIWVTPPTYSNVEGRIVFRGGVPNPGIIASDAIISTAVFRARDIGNVELRFTEVSQVLANDGNATNILENRGIAKFTIALPPPEGPEVHSPTHAEADTWYRSGDVTFFWKKDDGVDAFSHAFSQDPFETPDEVTEGAGTSAVFSNVKDGIWYFHIRSRSGDVWGGTTHYIVRIDRAGPAGFTVGIEPPGPHEPGTQPTLSFFTTDGASGIDHYEVRIVPLKITGDEIAQTSFFTEESSPWRFSVKERGSYQVIVRAYDKAGNFTDATERIDLVEGSPRVISREGIRIFSYLVRWPSLYLLLAILLLIALALVWLARRSRDARQEDLHRNLADAEEKLLREYQELYERVKGYRAPQDAQGAGTGGPPPLPPIPPTGSA
ncbi:MAG: cohesin domain-containing protein [bacterium]|nr:cohesin domain-containing protein [bacterium]